MSSNLGYLFWRECYKHGQDPRQIKQTIETLLKADAADTPVEAPHGFPLTTAYPGLLVGSGYAHGLPTEEDIKIGFFFDHTEGVPLIPGSSVKGTLRHLFGLPMKGKSDPLAEQKQVMIRALLKKPDLDVNALARAIFEGVLSDGGLLGPYERDIFYDARITRTRGSLLADDYLAPHPDPFENPIPIRFLKVAPGVTFRFAFRLVDTKIDGHVVTAGEKEILFAQLLSTFGVGAKTNVGYGAFEPFDAKAYEEIKRQEEAKRKRESLKQQTSDASDADRILTEIEIVKTAKTLQQKLKQNFADAKLADEEKERIVDAIRAKHGEDKFAKKAANFIKNL